jgi:hypothetical protein
MKRNHPISAVFFILAILLSGVTLVAPVEALGEANPVDLSTWTAESYPAVASFGKGVWTVADDGFSVVQSVNGQPTFFYSDFNAFDTDIQGKIIVNTSSDDDYIGFALGFRPGDSTNTNADYLLIDWKQRTQSFNFGSPSDTPGSTAFAGLAVSRVTGIPTADEFWGHVNFDHPSSDLDSGLEELARGSSLGSTGFTDYQEYTFRFEFGEDYLRVHVDDAPEIDITGSFHNGRLAFYNFSQKSVKYSGFTATGLSYPLYLPVILR